MEDLLLNLVKEAQSQKLPGLKQSAQEAHDVLCAQTNLLRNPAYELRAFCFKPLQTALESRRSKLVSISLNGLYKMVRDERFQSGPEPEDDSLWLPAQLLHATSSMLTHGEDTQVQILRVILQLACSASWALNGRLVMLLLGRCGEAYETSTQPVKAAAQAAASQTVMAFCTFLDEEYQEILQQQQNHKNGNNSAGFVFSQTSAVACFNEAIPVMQYICSRLEEIKLCPKGSNGAVFLLECLLALVSTLPPTVHSNIHFTTFLWQKFCPALLSLLGTPGDPTGHCLTSSQAKIVYSIGIQLVRLVGSETTLRPVLEALFHRMLLLPVPIRRLEPLRAIKELLRSPERLADLLLLSNGNPRLAGDDMAIIRLIMDSIEESAQCNDPQIMLASVECVVAMLGSLDLLCKGKGISQENASVVNTRYMALQQADYRGPLTYQSLARLPKPYRDVVANLKYQSDSDSSGIDGGANGSGLADEGTDSDASGVTEGPEEREKSDSEDSIVNDNSFLTSQELKRLQKLPKVLHVGRSGASEYNIDIERHNARHFVKTMQNILLPNLLSLRSSIQIDEVLQEFASKCCQHNSAQNYEFSTIMNADGIYLATYTALLLNLRLIQLGYYADNKQEEIDVPMTETQFVEEIQGSGVLVYLSATWLSELYQNVLATSLLQVAGYDPSSDQQSALVNLLSDIGGMGTSQLLTDWQRLERVHSSPVDLSPETEAGIKLSRRVLTCCWDSMVSVLSAPLEEIPESVLDLGANGSTLKLLLPRRTKRMQYKKKIRDNLVSSSLEGLHKAASLSNTLKLQARSSSILSLLATSACHSQSSKLLAAHALSLDVLLSKGIALGSHNSSCWQHVFSACVQVAKIEHALFSKAGTTQLLMVAQNANNIITSTTEKLNMSFNLNQQDEETCVDVYSFLQSPSNSLTNNGQADTTIADIINKSGAHNTSSGILSNVDAAKVCCLLSQQVDTLFHEAALKLNLPCLCLFLEELCSSSQRQLFSRTEESRDISKKWWRREVEHQHKPPPTLLLHRVGDVTLKCIKAGRPLIHTMKVWSIAGPHFMEAACHKDREVSKKAITCIHDAVTAMLNENLELPHFHFNEALFKPFENLLCLELCDPDVQEQIVACICEFVEANRTEICSGWRPLFGTLRVCNGMNDASPILEVFKIFLSNDNTLVFANAALDYIMCLLTHIRSSDSIDQDAVSSPRSPDDAKSPTKSPKQTPTKEKTFTFFEMIETQYTESKKDEQAKFVNLCTESLILIQNVASMLSAMYNMPKCPTFNMSHRIQIDTEPQLVDSIIQNVDVVNFNHEVDTQISYKILSTRNELEGCERENMTLVQLDKPSGILKIWYIMLEGLASATIICAKKNQPPVLETLFKLLRDLVICPGPEFGLYCINHLLLPMVQNWLRQNEKMQRSWDAILPNFKHCCGMASELVVEYLHYMQNYPKNELGGEMDDTVKKESPAMTLALKQLLLILVECVAQANENIARLGTSCIRHIILSSGQILTANQWEITVTAIHRACTISLNPLHQLTLAFKQNSDSFYGDLATVKVAARKDSTVEENSRLYQLARQLYSLSFQKESYKCNGRDCECPETKNLVIDDRSYVFLLYPIEMSSTINPDLYTVRVPFRNLIVGILAHQMLVQTISSALLQNLNHVTPILSVLQINTCSLRGILNHVNSKHVDILLKCLDMSSFRAKEFDSRPGLKFLTQKVGNLCRAANLYTQANTAEIVQIIILVELCLDGITKYNLQPLQLRNMFEQKEIFAKKDRDLDFIKHFLWKLKHKWEDICESFAGMSLEMDDESNEHIEEDVKEEEKENEEVFEKINVRQFKLSDLARTESQDSNAEENDKEELKTNNEDGESDVDKAFQAAEKNEQLYAMSKETEQKVEAMMEHYKSKTPFNSAPQHRSNPFTAEPKLPPPQPIPIEIQQQRTKSIKKDSECYRTALIETIDACLELLGSLPQNRIAPLTEVLAQGTKLLLNSTNEKIKNAAQSLMGQMDMHTE